MSNQSINKEFYERQIKRLEERLREAYSDDRNKTEHYFRDKGFTEGVIYAYRNILDELEELEGKVK